jgi:Raf kinase inhibitor-like YbhB/YbcL family protein
MCAVVLGLAGGPVPPAAAEGGKHMQLTSLSFANNQPIPERYSCEGDSVNPTLVIENVPAGAKSLALIVDDIDAAGGSFIHWFVFDIRPDIGTIEEDSIPGTQCVNSAKRKGYAGPCPPSGTHRYIFRLYALDTMLDLKPGAQKDALEQAMQGHIISQAEMTGLYKLIR